MRLAPSRPRRSLAAVTASALLFTGLGGLLAAPAFAATTIDSVTNPVNTSNQNNVVIVYSGVQAGELVTVTLTDGTTTTPAAPQATQPSQGTSGSRTVNASTLKDGVLTATVSGSTSGTASRQVIKDTVPPAAATNLTTSPTATVNASQQKDVQVSANAGADATGVRLRITDGTTSVDRFPGNAGGTYSASFDVTTLKEGTLTVQATTIDNNLNETTISKTLSKDTIAPTFGTYTYSRVVAPNKVNASTPGSGNTVGITVTSNEAAIFSLTAKDANNTTINLNSGTTPATSASFNLPPYGFADGTISLTTVAVDAAGNASAPGLGSLLKDVSVPVVNGLTVTPSPINDAGKSNVIVTGSVIQASGATAPSEPNTTVRLTPSCTVRPPNPVIVLDNPTAPTAQTVTMKPDGTFTSTPFDTKDCVDGAGSVVITAAATDPNGNIGPNATRATDKDTSPPANPVVTSLGNAVPANVTAVPFSGAAENGVTVRVTIKDTANRSVVTSVTAGPNGFSGTADLTTLNDGVISATAIATDAAGNVSTTSDPRSAQKDTTIFAFVTSSPEDGQTSKNVGSVSATFNEPLSLADSSIVVKDSNNAIVQGTTSYRDGNKTIAFTPTSTFGTGTYVATITGKESGPGNDPAIGKSVTFSVDPNAPASPSIQAITDPVNTTNQTAAHVTGSAEPNVTVTITVSAPGATSVTGTGTANGSGAFDVVVDVSSLPDGLITAVGRATRGASTSGSGNSKSATKDTVKPTVAGAKATDTTQGSPSTTVTATSNETGIPVSVTLTDKNNKKVTGTGTTGDAGAISVSVDASSLADGTIAVSVVVTDANGNPSDPSATTFAKDATGPSITNLSATPVNASSNGRTTVSGTTGEAGTVTVRVSDGTKAVQQSAIVSGTTFSVQLDVSGLADGTLSVTAVAQDAKGNTGPTSPTSTPKDSTAPNVTELAATKTGGTQNTSTVTGKTEAGASVVVAITDGTKTATKTVTADGSGAFSAALDLTGFAGGDLPLTAQATDPAGNTGPKASATASRDTTAPVITGLMATASTGDEPNSTVTGKVDDASATVSVTATDTNNKAVSGTATVAGNGDFSVTLDLSTLANGTITVTATATDAVGNAGTATTTTTRDSTARASKFAGLAPSRILDTRSGLGAPKAPVAPKGTLTLQVTGRGGVPSSGVASVVLNVTVVAPTSTGYLTVYPTGGTRPVVSNLNYVKGQTVPNLVVVPVSAEGKVSFFNGQGGRTDLLADVAGYFNAGSATAAGSFGSLSPTRILDTRSGNGAARRPVAGKGTLGLQVTGRGGVPSGNVSAVVLNVTAVSPTSKGYLTVYPEGGSRPVVSNLNFTRGTIVPNLVIVPVSSDGRVSMFNGQSGSIDLLADVAGYFVSGTPTLAGAFDPVAPTRILDTRSRNGVSTTSPVDPKGTVTLQVTGRGGVPATGVGSVVLNVTTVLPTSSGFATVYPDGSSRPVVSNLNFEKGLTVANLVVVPVGPDGKVKLFNGSAGKTHLLADVAGYFLAQSS